MGPATLLSIAQGPPLIVQKIVTMRTALSAMEVEVTATKVAVDLGQNGVVFFGDQQHCQLAMFDTALFKKMNILFE